MANIFDYLKWRGDLSFKQSEVNEVDFLILSTISYLRFSGIVDGTFKNSVLLKDAALAFKNADDFEQRKAETENVDPLAVETLFLAGESRRFGNLKMCAFSDILDFAKEEQFAAITFSCSEAKWNCVTFRGTDNNFVGWKEDFNLAYLDELPSQRDAVKYFDEAAKKMRGPLYIAGHSKGGNIAIYAAKFAKPKIQKRIQAIYNFDGPGFYQNFFDDDSYKNIKDKIKTYVPSLSIVGALFWHDTPFVVVESEGKGIYEHDPLHWHTEGNHFFELKDVTDESKLLNKTVNQWILDVKKDDRKIFVDSIFKVLLKTETKTLTNFQNNMIENLYKVFVGLRNLDKNTKNLVNNVVKLFARSMKNNVDEEIKKNSQNFFSSLIPSEKSKTKSRKKAKALGGEKLIEEKQIGEQKKDEGEL